MQLQLVTEEPMTKIKFLILLSVTGLALIGVGIGIAQVMTHNARGFDAEHKPTEQPSVAYDGSGKVSVSFAAQDSPVLAKWWNGRIVAECPAGYRFSITGTGSLSDPEQATCTPNPSN